MLTLDLAAQSWHQRVHLRSFSLTFESILFRFGKSMILDSLHKFTEVFEGRIGRTF
jgi:hypothetical protein